MPTRNDAQALDQETEQFIADRERREQEQARRDADAKGAQAQAAARENQDASFSVVQENSSRIESNEEELVWWRSVLRNWNERNREFMNISAPEIAGLMLWLATPLGVTTIDLLILSYVGREVAKGATEVFKGAAGGAWIVPLAVIAFTLAYIAVELAVGASRESTRLSSEQRRRAAQIALLLWLALPIFIVIFSLVNSGVFSTDAARTIGRGTLTAAFVRAIGFGMFALAAHGFILFFGPAIVNASGYAVFKSKQVRITRRIRDLERRIRAARGSVEHGVRDFHRAVSTGSDSSGEVSTGPFSTTTTRVVNETFGQEVIEPPARPPQAARPATRPSDGSAPAGTGTGQDGEDEGPAPRQTSQAAPGAAASARGPAFDGQANDPEWPGTIYDMSDEDEVR